MATDARHGAYKMGDEDGMIVYRNGEWILEAVPGPYGCLEVVQVPQSHQEIAAVSMMQP